MRVGRYIFLGTLVGLAACIWLTLAQPRTLADLKTKTATPTPAPSSTPTPYAPTPTVGTVAGQATIKILIYGVALTVTDPIEDLVYGEMKDGTNTWAGFTTKSLLAKYPDCKAGALGTLVRTKAPPSPSATPTPKPTSTSSASPSPYATKTPTNQPFKKTVGGYTYSYRPAYSTCTNDQAGRDTLAAARAAVKNGALPTLSQQ